MFKAIIIDDESDARETLSVLLKDYCKNVEVVGVSSDLLSGVKLIYKLKPDVVFLDIEMPEYSGLEILEFFDTNMINFQIIFTTAYSEYAIQAFELSAIDYLLKPIQISQLTNAVSKLSNALLKENAASRLEALKIHFDPQSPKGKLALPVNDGIYFINVDEIEYIKADRAYSIFHLVTGNEITVSKNLKEYEEYLESKNFFRVHRGFIVNLNRVNQYLKRDGGQLIMENDEIIPIGSDRKVELLQRLQDIHQ